MLLPFLISNAVRPIWASAEGRAMLKIYAIEVGVLVSIALAFKALVLG